MAALTLHRDLVAARASFQRLRDAKILHGWIDSIDGSRVIVKANVTTLLTPGERFAFRTACLSGDVAFEATLWHAGSEDTATLVALAAKGRTMLDLEEQTLTFEVDGRVVNLPLSGDPRYQCLDGTVTLGEDGAIEASLRDISPSGLGVLSPSPVPRGGVLRISAYTSAGQVNAEVEVRYCRKVGEQPEAYRVGLKFNNLDRVNRARWNTLFNHS
ncbi:MAG: PilZ domain-containing protein [Fimbriimonas sp.]